MFNEEKKRGRLGGRKMYDLSRIGRVSLGCELVNNIGRLKIRDSFWKRYFIFDLGF